MHVDKGTTTVFVRLDKKDHIKSDLDLFKSLAAIFKERGVHTKVIDPQTMNISTNQPWALRDNKSSFIIWDGDSERDTAKHLNFHRQIHLQVRHE